MDNIGVFGTFGRKTLAIMLTCIGDGIRDSLILLKSTLRHHCVGCPMKATPC